jgi:hypothetical protein
MYIDMNKNILDLMYSLENYLEIDCNNCHLMGCTGCQVPKEKEQCKNIIIHLEEEKDKNRMS